jgi:5-methylcytosine-specific restriction endonuclease McrA
MKRGRGLIRSKETHDLLFKKTKGRCWYCDAKLTKSGGNIGSDFCIDHLMPHKKGGSSEIDNLVACCNSCNSSKGQKTPEEYFSYLKSKGRFYPKLFARIGGRALRLKYGKNYHSNMVKKRWENQKNGQK